MKRRDRAESETQRILAGLRGQHRRHTYPTGIISLPYELTDEQIARFKAEFRKRSLAPAIIGRDIGWSQVAADTEDTETGETAA